MSNFITEDTENYSDDSDDSGEKALRWKNLNI